MLHHVTIGDVDRDALRARLERAGVSMNPAALALFADGRFVTARHPARVTVAARTVAALRLSDGGIFTEVVAAAAALGLRGYRAGADHRWSPDDVMAFARADALHTPATPPRGP